MTSNITELASASVTQTDQLIIELVEADSKPAVVLITWPSRATVLHPRRFAQAADAIARAFAAATVKLAHVRSERKL
jgi:hypothetical protein